MVTQPVEFNAISVQSWPIKIDAIHKGIKDGSIVVGCACDADELTKIFTQKPRQNGVAIRNKVSFLSSFVNAGL